MRAIRRLIWILAACTLMAESASACQFCSERRNFLGGWKCEWVYEDGETGHVECDDEDGFNCYLTGNACMYVVVIGGGGSGGGSGSGGGGGGSCLVIGSNWCPASCFSCTYQLV